MCMEEMLSLYDYLGKAAGKELGAAVNNFAKTNKIPVAIKEVSNPKYKGKIMMYPKSFLDVYFNDGEQNNF
jgi:hypothetical protein